MKQRSIITLLFVIIALIGIVFLVNSFSSKQAVGQISNFEDCKNAGYPILESFPEQCATPDGRTFTNTNQQPPSGETSFTTGKEHVIVVQSPTPNQVVTNRFIASGEARGNWYFEASFPVKLLDANGKVLASTYAQAQGEWMTENFVPFRSQPIVFSTPATATGTLVLEKDNPSGMPQYADEVRIPVRFTTENQATKDIKLFYYNPTLDTDLTGNVLCTDRGLAAVNRTIPVSQTPIQDTIRLLLKGELTAQEKAQGIKTEFPLAGVSLSAASLNNGTLTLTFSDPQQKTSGGSCRVTILREQIEATAFQFPEVKKVQFAPNTVFQP